MWKSLLPACRERKRSNCAFFLLNKIRNERSKVSRKSFSIWNFSSPSVDVYKATLTIPIWYASGIAWQSVHWESQFRTPTGFRGSQTLSTPELPLLKFLTREKSAPLITEHKSKSFLKLPKVYLRAEYICERWKLILRKVHLMQFQLNSLEYGSTFKENIFMFMNQFGSSFNPQSDESLFSNKILILFLFIQTCRKISLSNIFPIHSRWKFFSKNNLRLFVLCFVSLRSLNHLVCLRWVWIGMIWWWKFYFVDWAVSKSGYS